MEKSILRSILRIIVVLISTSSVSGLRSSVGFSKFGLCRTKNHFYRHATLDEIKQNYKSDFESKLVPDGNSVAYGTLIWATRYNSCAIYEGLLISF